MRLDPSWLLAATPRGVVAVRGATEVALELDAPFDALAALLDELTGGADPERLARAAGTPLDEARRALAALREHGVLVDVAPPHPRPEGVGLTDAILRVRAGQSVSCTWTADELLVLPEGAGAAVARRAVRAFVAALSPDSRAEAYAAVAALGRRSAAGDVPDAGAVAGALAAARAAAPGDVHAIALRDGERWSVAPADAGRLGMREPHRLGPLQVVRPVTPRPPLAGRRVSFVAEYAIGNLASPWPRAFRVGRGTDADAGRAELVARAEAAERFGAYEVDPSRLRRATAAELDAPAVTPDRLQAFAPRQYAEHDDLAPYRADEARLWMRGASSRGEPRWVPAEAVHVGLREPGPRTLVSSSSGLAAGASAADAADRALREAIERDAFMWTWVQRVSRERLDPRGLDPGAAALARAVEALGYRVALVNLTLEAKPVVLAALHREERVHVAAACRDRVSEAAAKALDEAALALSLERDRELPALAPHEVRTPEDHMWLHLRPAGVQAASFLWASPEEIAMEEVEAAPGPAAEAVDAVGEAVLVDLSSPRTAPFSVVRALVPGLVPMSFGYDREALGLARLARPARTAGGRELGRAADPGGDRPILPHPFP